jgi:hypothetical protein
LFLQFVSRPQQTDDGFGVVDLAFEGASDGLVERDPVYVEDLGGLTGIGDGSEVGGKEKVDALGEYARRTQRLAE